MRFGPQPLDAIEGAVLAHTHRLPSGVRKKGRVLSADDVEAFRAAGFSEVIVAQLETDDVGEDAAATRLASLLAGEGARPADASTGRVNFFATRDGLLEVDAAVVDAVNAIDERVTLATATPDAVVREGDLIATVKIIPFAVPQEVLEAAIARAKACVAVRAFTPLSAGLVLTRLPEMPESLLDRASRSQRVRMERLGGLVRRELRVAHEEQAVAAAIEELADDGCDPILLLGASAIIDREDVLPSALRAVGGEVRHLGMPVDPGNLLMLGALADTQVLGVPGCARSLKPSGFDRVLERLVCRLPVDPSHIAAMGVGGLLKEVLARPAPRLRAAQSTEVERVGVVLLAAGRSRRMGERNKLLIPVDGEPMVRRVARAAIEAELRPVVVVTGHQDGEVRAALDGLPLELVQNPDFAEGMSTSLKAGLRAIEGRADAAFVMLGDMPFVQPTHLARLVDALDPVAAKLVVVPVKGRQQGNPVLFSARLFGELATVSGDRGAKGLIREHADVVVEVAIDDEAVVQDLDTPESLEGL